jgi:glycosyltransferase involved in cell wall biosynthesis
MRQCHPAVPQGTAAATHDFGVNLVGYAAGELGIGEDVRMMVKSLLTTDIPFCVINRKPHETIRQSDESIMRHVTDRPVYPVTIICMTGFDTVQLALERPDVFDGKYVIGYWPWELPEWPAEWNVAYDLVDEIWASSHYTQSAYQKSSPKPVQYMPMTVSFDPPGEFRKSDFGLPEDRFLFLFAFDFMSYPSRKNPEGCLSAFQAAFPAGDEQVGLVLKVSNVDREDRRWTAIRKLCNKDPRIVLLGETLDRRRLLGLMSACDAYVSLHRAEGFGRTLAEAMLLNKPVIATGYSGSADYLTEDTGFVVPFRLRRVRKEEYPFAEGMRWAEPDTVGAATHFREVFENPEATGAKLKNARKLIERNYGSAATGTNYRTRIAELRAQLI